MDLDKFEEELKRVGLAKRHADSAFAWMRQHGAQGVYDIWYYEKRPNKKAAWFALDDDKNRYYIKEVGRLIYMFALKDKKEITEEPPFIDTRKSKFVRETDWRNNNQLIDWLKIKSGVCRNSEKPEYMDSLSGESEENMASEALNLLTQFNQIILYGPPGTGKTYTAKKILVELLGTDYKNFQDERWDIVQFHPSYNYEDFVRGVQVKTKDGQVFYETENKVFGKMCDRAAADSGNKYVLIIDEINRANVSAVLGELIYALEYRGKPIKTPYSVNENQNITIPKNLYIIGTMNTADRTIGQIDYAVRRRFAFVHCPPDDEIVKDKSPDAVNIYNKVQKLFDYPDDGYLSRDFDPDDVKIGHSYFLPDDEKDIPHNQQIANKIKWQVVPILREYVKDGVIQKEAESIINDIEKLDADEEITNPLPTSEQGEFYWEKDGKRKYKKVLGRMAFDIIKDFIGEHPNMNLEQLQQELFPISTKKHNRVELKEKAIKIPEDNKQDAQPRWFVNDDDTIVLQSGEIVCISNQWGITGESAPRWQRFREYMKKYGYIIIPEKE